MHGSQNLAENTPWFATERPTIYIKGGTKWIKDGLFPVRLNWIDHARFKMSM